MFHYNYKKLRGRIREMYDTQEAFASDLGVTNQAVSKKLNGKNQWTQNEMRKACELLEIDVIEIPIFFFTEYIGLYQ